MISVTLCLAGALIATGTLGQSATAVAASSASAAVYANLDLTRLHNSVPSDAKPTVEDLPQSPARVASVPRLALSEISTPPATPHFSSGDGSSTGGTPIGFLSFNSAHGASSVDASLSESDLPSVDFRAVVRRLQAKPLTGQVVAWAWEQASKLSQTKRAPPVSLLAALWPATESCASRCTAQDVVDIVDTWVVLIQRWPKHFMLAPDTLRVLSSLTIPAAVKRMSESRLLQLARACCSIANHRVDPSLTELRSGRECTTTASARDLVQPIFALVVADTAWRASDPVRYVSPDLLRTLITSSRSWRWTPVPYHDTASRAAIKASTAAALDILRAKFEKSKNT